MENDPTSSVAGSDFRPLDPRYVVAERIASWILFAIVLCAGLIALLIWLVVTWPPGLSFGIGFVLFLVILGLLAWLGHFLPLWSHQTTSWRLDENGLEIRRGIWWKKITTIPRARVQHTDVHQGPLMRRFELAKLVVHTAGTQEASVEVSGLSHIDAIALRDLLIVDKGVGADVV